MLKRELWSSDYCHIPQNQESSWKDEFWLVHKPKERTVRLTEHLEMISKESAGEENTVMLSPLAEQS